MGKLVNQRKVKLDVDFYGLGFHLQQAAQRIASVNSCALAHFTSYWYTLKVTERLKKKPTEVLSRVHGRSTPLSRAHPGTTKLMGRKMR